MAEQQTTQRMVEQLNRALSGAGTRSGTPTRWERNRSHNLLAGVMLNAFARQSRRAALTGLEQALVQGFKKVGFTDEDLSALGSAYAQAPLEARSRLFPERAARLGVETGFSTDDLRAELKAMAPQVVQMKNLQVLDQRHLAFSGLSDAELQRKRTELGIQEDLSQARPPPPGEEFLQAQRELGWSVSCVGITAAELAAARGASLGWVTARATTVYCHEGTHEVGNDEPFFGFAVCDGITGTKYVSEELSMDEGDERTFRSNTLWNNNVPGGGLCFTIDAWEADHSNQYDKEIAVLTEILRVLIDQLTIDSWADMAQVLIETGMGTGIPAEIIALFAAVIAAIIGFLKNEDDYIGTYAAYVPNAAMISRKELFQLIQGKSISEATQILMNHLNIDYMGAMLIAMVLSWRARRLA
ncbi:hypothetical protein [Archangium lansingense]|uniref:Uncharacterized protein n=1 Tax=Archangium lansingense TaxID=2995310 RepID=A0ABT4A851_9BACT|nr:hypothetical protein [Archangium lansinium]MCY1077828.1 hypothetical protein [Archangium lansinium]